MKAIYFLLAVALISTVTSAQKADTPLATTSLRSFYLRDLPTETQEVANGLAARIRETRNSVFDQTVNMRALALESASQNISIGKLLANEKSKAEDPTEIEIKKVYDSNRAFLGNATFEQAKKQIVAYLRSNAEQKILGGLFARLRAKFKFTVGKDVNSTDLSPNEVIGNIGGKPITAKEFEEAAGIAAYELKDGVSELVLEDLNDLINASLISQEAQALDMDAGEFIAREITNKMKDFSNEERLGLERSLREKLFAKYKVVINYKAPEPIVQSISNDDDPSSGPANAPVTLVMFSDFQCSACAATHPILKAVLAQFPDKVKFVVRDFPLESIHPNAFNAAKAAGAANVQGKFFEYIDVLYKNHEDLDVDSLKRYAGQVGLNVKQFELDFNSERIAAEIRKDMDDGDSYVVNSTPTIFVNGVRVRDISFDGLKSSIEKALQKTK